MKEAPVHSTDCADDGLPYKESSKNLGKNVLSNLKYKNG